MPVHNDDRRMYEAVQKRIKLTPAELRHLEHCEDCRNLYQMLKRFGRDIEKIDQRNPR